MKRVGFTVGKMSDEEYNTFYKDFLSFSLLFSPIWLAFVSARGLCVYPNDAIMHLVTGAGYLTAFFKPADVLIRLMYPGFRVFGEISMFCWSVVMLVYVGSLFFNMFTGDAWKFRLE